MTKKTKNKEKPKTNRKKGGGDKRHRKRKGRKVIYNDKNRSCKATYVTSKGVHAHIHTHAHTREGAVGGGNASKKWQLNYGQIISRRRGSFRRLQAEIPGSNVREQNGIPRLESDARRCVLDFMASGRMAERLRSLWNGHGQEGVEWRGGGAGSEVRDGVLGQCKYCTEWGGGEGETGMGEGGRWAGRGWGRGDLPLLLSLLETNQRSCFVFLSLDPTSQL